MRQLGFTAVLLLLALPALAQTTDRTGITTQTQVACAATSTSALPAFDSRNFLVLQNNSDTDIYVSVNTAATTSKGFRVPANGGGFFFDVKVPIGPLFCIHGSTGTKNLLVTEGRR